MRAKGEQMSDNNIRTLISMRLRLLSQALHSIAVQVSTRFILQLNVAHVLQISTKSKQSRRKTTTKLEASTGMLAFQAAIYLTVTFCKRRQKKCPRKKKDAKAHSQSQD